MSEPEHISITLGELLAQLEAPPVRHPIVRSGEREPIPLLVRLSVYLRDGSRCRLCGISGVDFELDHIKPWSAGGGDHSANLRTLCVPCNQRRSNYQDVAEERLPPPTTWWCWECWRHPDIHVEDPDSIDWGIPKNIFRSVWKEGTNPAAAPWVTDRDLQAYCGMCRTYSDTNVAFTEAMQPRLVELCAPRTELVRAAMRPGREGL